MNQPNFSKYADGLVPAVVQDLHSHQVLMLGYVSATSWAQTLETGKVTFYSRSRQEIWVKGETSGHYLVLKHWHLDCDSDSLLLAVEPMGPTCHTGAVSCFGAETPRSFLHVLQQVVHNRAKAEGGSSYTRSLLEKGVGKVAQKVGEEAVEIVIEAMRNEPNLFIGEGADLMFHLLVLLQAKGFTLTDLEAELEKRHKA